MRTEVLPLNGSSLGTQRTITALHFGDEAASRKIYIQASLHADELPGALTAYHLRQKFLALENAGQIKAHIVLVPMANPIGLGQSLHYIPHGRFDFFSGQNFNRLGVLDVHPHTFAQLKREGAELGDDAAANQKIIRTAMTKALSAYVPMTALESLHLNLLRLAHDADVVLDLHCDVSAILHMYTLPQLWPVFEPLARYLGSECQLLAEDSGVAPFDEALSTVWAKLQRDYPDANIPLACATTTVELRSQADISHEFAEQDANGIVQYLAHCGDIGLTGRQALPALKCEPHPLAGAQYVHAPISGVVVYLVKAGDWVEMETIIAHIVNPIEGTLFEVKSGVKGLIYARNEVHFTQQGDTLVSVSGANDLGLGAHLSP